jgi:hypothetical protein
MTTLSSLIVARRAASIAEVDDALARQVVRGGDLGTCLLELGVLPEEVLVSLLAEAHGLERVAAGELPVASPAVLRLVPRAVALRYGIYPLEESDGELRVAVSEPLPQAVEDDLGFALGAHLKKYAAPLVRIRQAIARDYGLPLDRRLLRLVAKLEHRPDPSPSEPPARSPGEAVQAGAVRLSKTGTMIMQSAVPPPPAPLSEQAPNTTAPAQRIIAPAGRRRTWPGMPHAPAEGTNPLMPALAPGAPASTVANPPAFVGGSSSTPVDAVSTPPMGSTLPGSTPSGSSIERKRALTPTGSSIERKRALTPKDLRKSEAPPADFVIEATLATAAQVESKRRQRAEHASGKALLGWARRALGNTIPADSAPERRRGPLTAAAAERQLSAATTGEEGLAIFFAFARQYFEYTVLFMVHGDLAAGHDAWGPGASRDKVRAIGVALDLPSALSYAKGRRTPTLVQFKRSGLDADLRADLSRPASHEVLVLPVMMRERCVALLYGDDGAEPVLHGEIGDVVAMSSLLSTALERILLRKKRAALRDPSASKNKLSEKIDRSKISASDAGTLPISAPSPVSGLLAKRGAWSEEEFVDEGWTLASDLEPRAPGQRIVTPLERRGARLVPQPTQPDADDPPTELIISEFEDPSSTRSVDPMASTSISAGPHPPPPPSQGPFRILPSVLIRSDLVDHVIAGGERAEKALGEILALGEAAIPSVFARFPGPLTVDRNQALGELPRPSDCGPVLRIVAAMRRLALPFLAVRSADIDVDVRFWATYLLGELNYEDSASALLPRLFDENPVVRRIAVRSARSLVAAGAEGTPIRKNLERTVTYADEPLMRRLTALSTIGELKLYKSIPALIEVLADKNASIVDGSVRALLAMTRQEFGKDAKKWRDWWETKGKKLLS